MGTTRAPEPVARADMALVVSGSSEDIRSPAAPTSWCRSPLSRSALRRMTMELPHTSSQCPYKTLRLGPFPVKARRRR